MAVDIGIFIFGLITGICGIIGAVTCFKDRDKGDGYLFVFLTVVLTISLVIRAVECLT